MSRDGKFLLRYVVGLWGGAALALWIAWHGLELYAISFLAGTLVGLVIAHTMLFRARRERV